MAQARDVEAALDAWRAGERIVGELAPGTPERAAAEAEVERLRDEYHQLVDRVPPDEPGSFPGDDLAMSNQASRAPDTIAS